MYESNYQKVLNSLRQMIKEGAYDPMQKLPDVETLSRSYGVSIMAAEQALETLEKQGLIIRKPGSGYFINLLEKKALGQVLIIEDEPQNRALLKEYSSSQGYTALIARDGYEASRAIQKQDYDLVFLDLRLPGVHGIEILRKIKEIRPGIPVVVVSGFPEDILKIHNKSGWPEMIISKPYRLSQIKEAIGLIRK